MAVIRVSNLGVTVGSARLLTDVSFDLGPGELVAVCGPNGAGKSTLLKCLAGQLAPTSGDIFAGQSRLRQLPPDSVARWRAVLPQSGAIPFDFTAEEIVRMGRTPHGDDAARASTRKIVDDALALADAAHLRQRLVTTLSGGEMQRVHLARVLAQIWEPVEGFDRLLLLDEPTSALDPRHQLQILRVVREWVAGGVAALVILHDINLALRFATRVILLADGRPLADGPPADICIPQTLATVFGIHCEILAASDGTRFLAQLQPNLCQPNQ